LEDELNEKSETLDFLSTDDISQLFYLRREIDIIKERVEALAIRKSWHSKIPIRTWYQIVLIPLLVYLVVIGIFQMKNQRIIQVYGTQTLEAVQNTVPSKSITPVGTSTANQQLP
jgi:hypothetical protein